MTEISLESSYALPTIDVARKAGPREIAGFSNVRTLEILESRRTARQTHRRGWLVRRMLLFADLAGLATAFIVVELAFGTGLGTAGRLHPSLELGVLLATLDVASTSAHLRRRSGHPLQ